MFLDHNLQDNYLTKMDLLSQARADLRPEVFEERNLDVEGEEQLESMVPMKVRARKCRLVASFELSVLQTAECVKSGPLREGFARFFEIVEEEGE